MSEGPIDITAKGTVAANTAAIFYQAITNPGTPLILVPPDKIASPAPEKESGAIVNPSHFLYALLAVSGFTVLFILLWGLIAFYGSTETENRTEFLHWISHAAAMGFGAIVGLLGAKQLS
jgi:hypothetical protein